MCRRYQQVAAARPRQVLIAWWLLVAVGVLSLVNGVIGLVVRPGFDIAAARLREAVPPEGRQVLAELSSALTYDVVFGLGMAVVVTPLLAGLRGPLRWARITALVVLLADLLAQVVFIGSNPAGWAEPRPGTSFPELWDWLVPDWYGPSQHTTEILLLAVSVAAVVLLCLEAAREYFAEGLKKENAYESRYDQALRVARRANEPDHR